MRSQTKQTTRTRYEQTDKRGIQHTQHCGSSLPPPLKLCERARQQERQRGACRQQLIRNAIKRDEKTIEKSLETAQQSELISMAQTSDERMTVLQHSQQRGCTAPQACLPGSTQRWDYCTKHARSTSKTYARFRRKLRANRATAAGRTWQGDRRAGGGSASPART